MSDRTQRHALMRMLHTEIPALSRVYRQRRWLYATDRAVSTRQMKLRAELPHLKAT